MGPLFVKMTYEAFDVRGRLGRGQFLVLCLFVCLAQLPALYILITATGSPAVFSVIFNIVLFWEALLATVLICGLVRRVRDAGGNAWMAFGFLSAGSILVAETLVSEVGLEWPALADGGMIATFAFWSCLGFGMCIAILTAMPTLAKPEDEDDFEIFEVDQEFYDRA